MLHHYILSYMGDDRPGLVDELANTITQHKGSWLESRLANLGGHFTGVARISVAAGNASALEQALQALNGPSVVINLTPVNSTEKIDGRRLAIKVTGADRSGIVSEISRLLVQLGINVEELNTDVQPAAWSGEPLFEARLTITMPATLDRDRLRGELERLSDDLMVDILQTA